MKRQRLRVKNEIGRSGRPLRNALMIVKVEPETKLEIREAAKRAGLSVTGYLLSLHHAREAS